MWRTFLRVCYGSDMADCCGNEAPSWSMIVKKYFSGFGLNCDASAQSQLFQLRPTSSSLVVFLKFEKSRGLYFLLASVACILIGSSYWPFEFSYFLIGSSYLPFEISKNQGFFFWLAHFASVLCTYPHLRYYISCYCIENYFFFLFTMLSFSLPLLYLCSSIFIAYFVVMIICSSLIVLF